MIGHIRSKMKMVRYIGVLVFTLVALSAPMGGVFADEPDQEEVRTLIAMLNEAPDPDAAFARLTSEQQVAVDEALTDTIVEMIEEVYDEPATYGASGVAGSASEKCKTHEVVVTNKTSLGAKVWTYKSKTRWCYDGSVITSKPSFTRGKSVHMTGWEFVGHTDKSESGGKGDWLYKDYTEGHFRYCSLITGACIQNHYPDISKRQYGNGDYDSDWDY